jgi:hypothetical protein
MIECVFIVVVASFMEVIHVELPYEGSEVIVLKVAWEDHLDEVR